MRRMHTKFGKGRKKLKIRSPMRLDPPHKRNSSNEKKQSTTATRSPQKMNSAYPSTNSSQRVTSTHLDQVNGSGKEREGNRQQNIAGRGERAISSEWWGILPPKKKRTRGDREDGGDHLDLTQYKRLQHRSKAGSDR
jgi:hypothetical protein